MIRPAGTVSVCLAWLAASLVQGVAAPAAIGSAAACRAAASSSPQSGPFDTIIEHGHIIDGTGSPWYSGQVGIRAGRIAAIGNLDGAPRRQTIDAQGRVVAPGFIDMLGQSELTILVDPRLPSKIYQGITTEITGEGDSVAPLNAAMIAADRRLCASENYPGLDHIRSILCATRDTSASASTWRATSERPASRRMVLGDADVQPNAEQLRAMQGLVRQAMLDGAAGLSTALQYAPAPYAKTEELIALASEAAKYGGIYATHMRSEGNAEAEAIDEAVRIGREAHIPVEIWHLKAAGKSNWGTMPAVIARIEAARAAGVDVSANTYAYDAWFNSFSAFIPPWAHDGGDAKLIQRLKDPATRARIRKDMLTPGADWDNEWQEIPGPEAVQIAVVQNPKLLPLQGKRLSEIAALWHEDAIDALCDLLIQDQAFTEVAVFGMSEPDVVLALKQPWVSIDNDSQGTSPEGLLGAGTSSSARLWHLPPHLAQIRARRARAEPRGGDPQVQRSACATPAPDRPRGAQAGHVG